MDRTSRTGVFICLLLLLILAFSPTSKKPAPATTTAASTPGQTTSASKVTPAANEQLTMQQAPSLPAPVNRAPVEEKLNWLENDDIKATLTTDGAAIKEIELKKHNDNGGKIRLNQQAHSNVLQLEGWPGLDTASFQVTESTPQGVTYQTDLPNGLKWQRSYTVGQDYVITVKDSLTNPGTADLTLPAYSLSVGRAEPLWVNGHYILSSNQFLGSGWFTSKFRIMTLPSFNPGGFLFFTSTPGKDRISSTSIDDSPVKWLGVENQFFAVLLTPGGNHTIQHAEFQCFNPRDASGSISQQRDDDGYLIPQDVPDIEAAAYFPEVKVPAGQTVAFDYTVYAGPKDYNRLNDLGEQQGEIMNYGMFSLLIGPMLSVLHFFYTHVGNYGVAIILLTLMIKLVTWPLQSFANRSGKRMQALAPKLKELQAKFKDQPEKLQTETFGMYREYGVNPFGGCLPAFIQMPVFFSLYFMLQNAVELRGQSFLWVHDLTQPDTIFSWALPFALPFHITHLAINPLPLMVTGLTMVMMRMTPQIGDPQQAKIMQWMPLMFLFIFYNFAAGLSLYYVINNCVSIIQIYRNLRKPLPELVRKPRKK